MMEYRRAKLSINMLVCTYTVKNLLSKISFLEEDQEIPIKEKLIQIKKIKEELTKVGIEIDSIKREIMLSKSYGVN